MDWRKPQLTLWRLEQAIKTAAADAGKGRPMASHTARLGALLAACTAAAPALAETHRPAVDQASALAAAPTPQALLKLAEIVSAVHLQLETAASAAGVALLHFRADGLPKEKPPAFVESVASLLGVG